MVKSRDSNRTAFPLTGRAREWVTQRRFSPDNLAAIIERRKNFELQRVLDSQSGRNKWKRLALGPRVRGFKPAGFARAFSETGLDRLLG